MSDKISVLLVDDHALVRRGFRRMLDDDETLEVVGEASNGTEAVQLAEKLRPQVIVMDCQLPELTGVAATRIILRSHPETAILMLSMHSEDTLVRQALGAGARGYVLKNANDLDLASAIKNVVAGKSNKEIASELGLSVNTVSVHRANIMERLGIHKTAELVVYAIRNGLVNLP